MKKLVIVINGAGGVGKDTLCDLAKEEFKVTNISSITPIKEIATLCGWDGRKDDKSRKFLSDLKLLTVEYNDFPTAWATERYFEFLSSDAEIMFVHIREPKEIEKFVKATANQAKTLLVRGGKRLSKTAYGNSSDDDVEKYNYDYYFMNDGTIEEARDKFIAFLKNII
jgi:hypothetical protein